MNRKQFWFAALFICSVVVGARADIAPDPGYKDIFVPLFIETHDDLSDYRFFFNGAGRLREVKIKKGEVMEVKVGGDSGELLAIPKMNLGKFSDELSDQEFIELKRKITEGKIRGVIELVRHIFFKTVPRSEKTGNSVYRLEKDESKGIKATLSQTDDKEISFESYPKNNNTSLLIIAGGFISAAFLFLGIWLFRKKQKNLA